jgi:hypothetical protein
MIHRVHTVAIVSGAGQMRFDGARRELAHARVD